MNLLLQQHESHNFQIHTIFFKKKNMAVISYAETTQTCETITNLMKEKWELWLTLQDTWCPHIAVHQLDCQHADCDRIEQEGELGHTAEEEETPQTYLFSVLLFVGIQCTDSDQHFSFKLMK